MPRTTLRRLLTAALLVAAAAAVALSPATAGPGWRMAVEDSAVAARYTIDATLATIEGEDFPRQIRGRERIVFTNLSHDRVDSLWFHLYPNAFRDGRSAFLREMARDGGELPDAMVFGGTDVHAVNVQVGAPGRAPVVTYPAEDSAPDDRTVMRVNLPHPLEPQQNVILNVEFTTTLPKPVARMGAVKDFVFAAQWFPKLGRHLGSDSKSPHLRDGTWFCPPYHHSGEFAADFADYDVTLRTPSTWTVGATGTLAEDQGASDPSGLRTRRYVAPGVVDFAWTAGWRLVERVRRIDPGDVSGGGPVAEHVRGVRTLLGGAPEDFALPPVEVVLLLQPEHLDQEERHFDAARAALALYGTWLGPYPYPRLTIVDPAFAAGATGGMEYPMLVTAGTSVGTPAEARRPEHVVVHEIGHQWFMNLLATNETLEAWLDEALNTWFTARAMDVAWDPPTHLTTISGVHFPAEMPYTFPGLAAGWPSLVSLPGWAHPPEIELFRLWRDGPTLFGARSLRYAESQGPALPSRRSWNRAAGWDEMIRPSWEYADGASYRGNAYPRGVLLLEALAHQCRARHDRPGDADGERRVVRTFREYARQFRFRHPTTLDLVRVLRQETGMADLPQTFDALARSTGVLDYAVESVRVVEGDPPGAARDGREPETAHTEIVVRRRGEIAVPVTVRAEIHGAAPAEVRWDGAERWTRLVVPGRARNVRIDPQRIFLQDANLSDNDWSDRRDSRPGAKWGVHALLWLEHALTGWGRFF